MATHLNFGVLMARAGDFALVDIHSQDRNSPAFVDPWNLNDVRTPGIDRGVRTRAMSEGVRGCNVMRREA
jgi:hypothetical protein